MLNIQLILSINVKNSDFQNIVSNSISWAKSPKQRFAITRRRASTPSRSSALPLPLSSTTIRYSRRESALWAIAVLKLTDKCLLPQLHSHSVSVKAQILQRAITLHVVPGCVHQGSVMFVHHSFEQ